MAWRCPECGFQVHGGATRAFIARHTCDPNGVARVQAGRFDAEFAEWLESPAGRFEAFYAQRRPESSP